MDIFIALAGRTAAPKAAEFPIPCLFPFRSRALRRVRVHFIESNEKLIGQAVAELCRVDQEELHVNVNRGHKNARDRG